VRRVAPENLDDRAARCQKYRNDIFLGCMEGGFAPRAECEWMAEMEYLKCMGYPVKPPTTMN
jgi:hypothetical protein